MVKPGAGNEQSTQSQVAQGIDDGALEAHQKFNPDETLLAMDEFNIGPAYAEREEMIGGDSLREECGLAEDVTRGDAVVGIAKAPMEDPVNEHGIQSTPETYKSLNDARSTGIALAVERAVGNPEFEHAGPQEQSKMENNVMSLHDSIDAARLPGFMQVEVSRVAGEDAWMEIIENHPELSYHQAEILRQVAGMTPETMDKALDRCDYLLERMRKLGPAALNLSFRD